MQNGRMTRAKLMLLRRCSNSYIRGLSTILYTRPEHPGFYGITTARRWMLSWMTSKAWRLTFRFSRNSWSSVYSYHSYLEGLLYLTSKNPIPTTGFGEPTLPMGLIWFTGDSRNLPEKSFSTLDNVLIMSRNPPL